MHDLREQLFGKKRKRIVRASACLGGVAVVAWLFFIPGPAPETTSPTGGPRPAAAIDSTKSDDRTPSRVHVATPKTTVALTVLSAHNRKPIDAAGIYPSLGQSVDLSVPALTMTSKTGHAAVQAVGAGSLVAWKEGYVPGYVPTPRPGEHYTVSLQSAARQEIHVRTLAGDPVSGIPIILSSEGVSRAENAQALHGAYFVTSDGRRRATSASATTGRDGRAVIRSLRPGRYWIEVALEESGFQLDNLGDCIQVDTPAPPVRVRVREIVGAVVRFVGDEVLAVRQNIGGPKSPFAGPKPYREMIPVIRARARLLERHPGCYVFVNGKSYVADASHTLSLSVLGRSGHVSSVKVPIRPINQIVDAWSVALDSDGKDRTTLVTIAASRAHLSTAALPDVKVVSMRNGMRMTWRASIGGPIRLPHGEVTLLADSRILLGAFRPSTVMIGGTQQRVEVDFGDLNRFELQILLPDGMVPKNSGLAVRGRRPGGRRFSRSLSTKHGKYTFWAESKELKVRAFVAGYPAKRFRLVAGEETDHNGRMVFVLRFGKTSNGGGK